jgi:hypothetical protein
LLPKPEKREKFLSGLCSLVPMELVWLKLKIIGSDRLIPQPMPRSLRSDEPVRP